MTDPRILAAALVNTKSLPAGLSQVIQQANQARAYHSLDCYPQFNFKDWKSEDMGPLPRCLPLARSIVKRGAKWLFGKPLQINVPANPALQKMLRSAWTQNKMGSRLVALAEKGAIEGGVVLKFSYDEENKKRPLTFQTLSLCSEVRLYYHPHDRTQLLLARISYAYFDPAEQRQMFYREEWTAEEEIHYLPIPASDLGRDANPDAYENWIKDDAASQPNPFKVIPLVHIKNLESDDAWGNGDLWELGDGEGGGLYRVIDRMHLCYHLMERSNQYDSNLTLALIDLEVADDDIDKPLAPGQPLEVHSKEGSGEKQGKIQELGGSNALRPAMMDYSKDLKRQVLAAASSVEVDQAEFSNKGNLTEAVLVQLYQAQIEITDEKHKSWGADGLEVFLELVAQGLQAAGATLGVDSDNEDTYDVQVVFADYFELSEDEKAQVSTRAASDVKSGFTTQERATMRVAHVNNVADTDALMTELGPVHTQMQAQLDNQAAASAQALDSPVDAPVGNNGE